LGTIYEVIARREPRIAQTFVFVVVEAVGPVALPLLLASIIPGQDRPVGASSLASM
jgi:hypothetical protein